MACLSQQLLKVETSSSGELTAPESPQQGGRVTMSAKRALESPRHSEHR
jgi:hypothetical protein